MKEVQFIKTDGEYEISDKYMRDNLGYIIPDNFEGVNDAEKLQNAYNYACANNKIILLNRKLNITQEVKFDKTPVTIIGSRKGVRTQGEELEKCDLNLEVPIKITRVACPTFYCVSFGGKHTNSGVHVSSFQCVFDNCFFFNFTNGILIERIEGETNWIGENYIKNCVFSYCDIGIKAVSGNDGFIDSCIFPGTTKKAMDGTFAGYNITNNHFYSVVTSVLDCANTLFSNNYVQEITDFQKNTIPSIEFTGISVQISNTKLEMLEAHDNTSPNGILFNNLQGGECYISNLTSFPKDFTTTNQNVYAVKSTYQIRYGGVLNWKGLAGLQTGGSKTFQMPFKYNGPTTLKTPATIKWLGGTSGFCMYLLDYTGISLTYSAVCKVSAGFYIATWKESGVAKSIMGTGQLDIATYGVVTDLQVFAVVTLEGVQE